MVDFAGFEMPVQYRSIKAEHAAVRERAGLFDVSHMGQIHLHGPAAAESVGSLVSCRMAGLTPGRVRYGCLCNDDGGVVDDVTVYCSGPESFFLCVNASNAAKDLAWIRGHAREGTEVEDRSEATALLALQGPASIAILASLSEADPAGIGRFRFRSQPVAGRNVLVSRTGYTGSEGFELYTDADDGGPLWDSLLDAGRSLGLEPAGLGARDTLRLEAALPLYGHELDEATSPLEAGLGRFVDLARGGFIGADAIARRLAAGHARQLVGFELEARGIARAGYALRADGADVGIVTSGAPSPTLGKSIGLGYVPPAVATLGTPLEVVIRERGVAARVVRTPFVSNR
jgi:aminomethyltransferase